MSQKKETTIKTQTTKATQGQTKDSGRVHIGGGLMRFAKQVKDAGRVHIGGGLMRF